MAYCNCCLRPLDPKDSSLGLCGPCNRQETPESNPDMLEEE